MQKAHSFTLKNQDGDECSLSDFAGKWLVLYFYPKDDTPGCTAEACSFRDVHDDLLDASAEVIGISTDNQDSHQKFKAKHALNFTLLSDPDGEVARQYGAWSKKRLGRREGIERKTFLIDPEGNIRHDYGQVTPMGHGGRVLKDLKIFKEQNEAEAYGSGSF